MALNVIMMGPPGAGKGTQAGRFARERGLLKISTGDILREGFKENLPVALRAKELMDRGELVDDATMIAIVRDRLMRPDAKRGFVLDGFPRTVPQAEALDTMLDEIGKPLDAVILLQVSDDVATERLRERAAKEGRADDSPEGIANRLRQYHELTELVVDRYQQAGIEVIVDGEQTMDVVFAAIQDALEGVTAR